MNQDEDIKAKIYTIRGLQVMLDRDLAELYGVETRRLNEQVKRNSERFPNEFMFQLTKQELENWISQFATSNKELELDLKKHNAQYPNIALKKFNQSHDRFLILDQKEVYHIGASLKDLGKKWFAFSKLAIENLAILEKLDT